MDSMKIVSSRDIFEMIEKGRRDFKGSKFYGMELRGRDLSGMVFDGSSFEWCFFQSSKFVGASFKDCEFKFCTFLSADLTRTSFEGTKMQSVDFENAIFNGTSFRNSNISYINFMNVNVPEADLTGATTFKIARSWSEFTEEDLKAVITNLEKAGLPLSTALYVKKEMNQIMQSSAGMKFSYGDFGDKFLSSSGKAYQTGEGGKKSDVYLWWGSAYVSDAGYGAKQESKTMKLYK